MAFPPRTARPVRISPADAPTRSRAGEAVLLDVREEAECAAGLVTHAVPLPLSRLSSNTSLPRGTEGGPVLGVCRSGNRSRQTAGTITARGMTALDVTGGVRARTQAGLSTRDAHGRQGRLV